MMLYQKICFWTKTCIAMTALECGAFVWSPNIEYAVKLSTTIKSVLRKTNGVNAPIEKDAGNRRSILLVIGKCSLKHLEGE